MTTLEELKNYVVAWNTPLRESVQQMDAITLLRNSHPAYRGAFASALLNEKAISKFQCEEFIKVIGSR